MLQFSKRGADTHVTPKAWILELSWLNEMLHHFAPFCILIVALFIDFTFGEPPWLPRYMPQLGKLHPVVWVSKLTTMFKTHLRSSNPVLERLNGVLLALTVTLVFTLPVYFGLGLVLDVLGVLVYVIMAAVVFKITFCIKLETEWALATALAVKEGDLTKGRMYASLFSRRDTQDLTSPQIISAIIESMAENLPDFKLSPIMYCAFLGVPGAVACRTINILDGTLGFKDPEHIHIGWFSANLDTITNYIPARISMLLIVLASAILGENYVGAWTNAHQERAKVSSTNHGWPIAAMSGALDIRLEKTGFYVLGENLEEPTPNHIIRALKIRNAALLLCILFLLPAIFLINLCGFAF